MKAKEVAMVVAIAILSALFVGLFYDALFELPKYKDYCTKTELGPRHSPKPEECLYKISHTEQEKIDKCYAEEGFPQFNYDKDGCQTSFQACNFCNKEFQKAEDEYNGKLFFVIAPLAVIAIIGGIYWTFEVIGTGFMFGGILLLIYSTVRYFTGMSKIFRVIVIGIELLLVLFISIKKLKK